MVSAGAAPSACSTISPSLPIIPPTPRLLSLLTREVGEKFQTFQKFRPCRRVALSRPTPATSIYARPGGWCPAAPTARPPMGQVDLGALLDAARGHAGAPGDISSPSS